MNTYRGITYFIYKLTVHMHPDDDDINIEIQANLSGITSVVAFGPWDGETPLTQFAAERIESLIDHMLPSDNDTHNRNN